MAASDLSSFILGSYQLSEVLGTGAMGYVYRARQVNLDRDVAIKVLSPHLSQEIGYIDLFMREARIAASLEHPHIIAVFDYGVQQDVSYVVMRLLPGGSLGDRLKYRIDHLASLPNLAEISHILTQAASALDYAHGRGVIHRDIKPNNLMFDQHGVVYVVDFGIAKLVGTTSSVKGSTFLGTPSFMAPEQWQGDPATPALDQYALGAVVYMMLTGHPPFESEVALALLNKHLHETPKAVQHYRPSAPDQLNAVLQRAMAKQPEDRFPNNVAFAQAFAAAVRDVEEEKSTEFTTFPLPLSTYSVPFPTPIRLSPVTTDTAPSSEVIQTPSDTAERSSSRQRQDYLLWALGGLIVLLAFVIIVLFASQQASVGNSSPTAVVGGGGGATATPSPTLSLEATQQLSGGEIRPISQVESTEAPTDTATATSTATFTLVPSDTPTATDAAASVATALPSDTATFTATHPPSETASPTASQTPGRTPSHTPTVTDTASNTPTLTASPTPTDTPSSTPSPTETPTATATETATATATTGVVVPRRTVNWQAGTALQIDNPSGVWLRSRPSTRGTQVATLAQNNSVVATGRSQYDGRQWWWEVTASWGAVGWVEQYSLRQA